MFLKKVVKKNKSLIKFAFDEHQKQTIAANTYIIDLDAIAINAKNILNFAKKNQMELIYLPKQFSHLSIISKKIIEIGYQGVILDDFKEIKNHQKAHIKVIGAGYYQQICKRELEAIVNSNLDYLIVYALEKMRTINNLAKANNKIINIVIRVSNQETDIVNNNAIGGLLLSELGSFVKSIKNLHHIKIIGLTSAPCFIDNWEIKQVVETPNFFTLKKAQAILASLGINNTNLYIPTNNLFEAASFLVVIKPHHEANALKVLSKLVNQFHHHQALPSIIYLSEISHNFNAKAYLYSNGIAYNSNLTATIVGDKISNYHHYNIQPTNVTDSNDYLTLDKAAKVGHSALLAFNWQLINNNSQIVLATGIQHNQPKILAIYDSVGTKIR